MRRAVMGSRQPRRVGPAGEAGSGRTMRQSDEPDFWEADLLEALVAATLDAIVIIDHDGRIVAFNTGAEKLFAYKSEDVIGKLIDTLLLGDIVDNRTTERISLRARLPAGDVFPVEGSITTVRRGRSTRAMLILRGATPLRRTEARLRESEERFRVAFDGSPIAFALTAPDGRMRAVNRSLCDMLGYNAAELQALTYKEISHPDDLARDVDSVARLLAGEIDHYRFQKRFIHKDGHEVWGLLAVSLARDDAGAPLMFVAQATDITALKEAEQALLTHATELERSNAELEQLAYVASHDLQEPLRVVASYVEFLAERYKGQLDEDADRWIGYVSGGVEHMKSMIDALLALARVTTESQPFASAAFAPIINRTWQELLKGGVRRDARLSCGSLPTLVVDASQIGQLFQNLLGNAFKYSRSDVPLRAHISAERRIRDSGAVWEFAVRDNGIGLDVAEAGRIFQIFQRLHRDAEIKGTGIGLAICKRIVERHGGRLWVESTPGEGATFRFTIRERAK